MKVFGCRFSRIYEWILILRMEGVSAFGIARMILLAALVFFTFRTAKKAEILSRYRTCVRCPVFRAGFHQCRASFVGRTMGCGCYMPFKVIFTPSKKPWCWRLEV